MKQKVFQVNIKLIVDNLEYSLVGYKDKLCEINTEMKSLQERSTEITIKLKNRKLFEEGKK